MRSSGVPDPARRAFLLLAGRSAVAVAVLGPVACTTAGPDAPSDTTGTAPSPTPTAGTSADAAPTGAGTGWERVDLGFVSAYVLVRGGEAAVVDTGVEGSADQIEAALGRASATWDDVGHVILTHRHPDHVGSVGDVLSRAPGATVAAGAGDAPAVPVDDVMALQDGDRVFDLTIVATPGHTPGHVSVLDPATRVLVAGDALNGNEDGSAVLGPDPEFTADMDAAMASVAGLTGLDVGTVLFGHGEPFVGDASSQIAALVE